MAGSPLIPDITSIRPEKVPPRNASRASDGSEKPFQDVQKDVAKASRPKPEDRADTAVPANEGRQTAQKPAKAESEQSPTQADAGPASSETHTDSPTAGEAPPTDAPVAATPDALLEQALIPDEDAFALVAPVPELPGRGNSLPFAAPTAGTAGLPPGLAPLMEGVPAGPPGLQTMFMQMATGNAGKDEGAAAGAAEIDLETFKSTLTEALESRGSRPADAPAPTMMTSQRGLEIREGSALIRQYSTTVDTPVQQGDWGDKMAGKISWLASQSISFAEIHLNPADLGPIDVRVSVQNDQASVAVHAQHASVRDLLELNGQRLRDMMQDNGLNLAKMDISDQPPRQQQQASGDETGQGSRGGDSGTDDSAESGGPAGLVSLDGEAISTGSLNLQWRSQVDTYA